MAENKELILVADDEPTLRILMKTTLEHAGYQVVLVENGKDALESARKLSPSVALIDAIMPGIDGFEVCRRLKSMSVTSNIPVLMVTSLSEVSDIQRGFEAGALDYIRKPFNPPELLIRIRNACAIKRAGEEQHRWRRKVVRELYLAEKLQKRLLSNPPITERNYALNSSYRPSMSVSGDVFDQFVMTDGKVCFYIADVCGHGVAAALLSSLIKAVASEIVLSGKGESPSAICNKMDSKFRFMLGGYNTYVTAFVAIYDPPSRRMDCMNCGHPSPILIKSDGDVRLPFVRRGGLPLGFALSENNYSVEDEVALNLEQGDSFFAYTDGLIEASHKETGAEFGVSGLKKVLIRVVAESDFEYRTASFVSSHIDEMGYDVSEDDSSVIALHSLAENETTTEARVRGQFSAIEETSEAVEKGLIARGWKEKSAWAVGLLINEYCNNALRHGGVDEEMFFEITVRVSGSGCLIKIVDPGAQLDLVAMIKQSKLPEDGNASGRGCFIINEIARQIDYYRSADRNIAYFVVPQELTLGK